MQKQFSLASVIDADGTSWGDPNIKDLKCPECGCSYQHFGSPRTIDSNDRFEAGWPGRGDLIVIPMWGECGSGWELCFGCHKGNTAGFVRLTKSCRQPESFIYFIEATGLQKIKIGLSDHPEKRLAQLATGSPVPLRLVATTPGDSEAEKKLHKRFDHLRFDGSGSTPRRNC